METLRDLDIVRAVPAQQGMVLRADGDPSADAMPVLVSRFSPFNAWYEISSFWEGDFMERTVRGAFAKTIAERRDQIKILYDHGYDPSIGNKVLAAIDELTEDADSARGEGRLFDTSYNRDLLPGLIAGVYGSSFRFRVVKEEWNDEPGVSDHNPKGLPERTITEIKLFEFGPVTFPASPSASAGVRSMTDAYYERVRSNNPEHYDDLLARAREIRTPDRAAAAPSGTAPAAAATPTDEPAESHSSGRTAGDRRRALHPILRSTA